MRKDWKAFGSFGTIGLEFVLSIMFGLFGGRWLDGKLGTGPWLAVIGFGLGTAAGVRAIYRAMKEMQKISAQEEREEGNPAPMFPDEAAEKRDRAEEPSEMAEEEAAPDSGKPSGKEEKSDGEG